MLVWEQKLDLVLFLFFSHLKIRTISSVIGSVIFKSVLKSCVIGLIIHKFYIKSSVIQSYGFTNIFDFIIDLNRFVWIF